MCDAVLWKKFISSVDACRQAAYKIRCDINTREAMRWFCEFDGVFTDAVEKYHSLTHNNERMK